MSASYEAARQKLARMIERDYIVRRTIARNIKELAGEDGTCGWLFDEASDLRAICQELLSESLDAKTKPFIMSNLKILEQVEKSVPQIKRKLTRLANEVATRNPPHKPGFEQVFAHYHDAVSSTMVVVQKLEAIRASSIGMAVAGKEIPKELVENPEKVEEGLSPKGERTKPPYIG